MASGSGLGRFRVCARKELGLLVAVCKLEACTQAEYCDRGFLGQGVFHFLGRGMLCPN